MKKLIRIIVLFLLFIIMTTKVQYSAQKSDRIKRFALVVGANDGGEGRHKLLYAINDALAVSNVLCQIGGVVEKDCIVIKEPNRVNFFNSFKDLRNKVYEAKSNFSKIETFIYYSGHSDNNFILLGNEKISYEELRKELSLINSDVKIAILDCCDSGSFTRTKGGVKKAPFLMDSAYNMKGIAYISSSNENEASQESDGIKGSFFTHNLIGGMRGAADMNEDGKITLNEAYQYTFNETLAQTKKTVSGPQHPRYNIQMSGTGDIILTDVVKSPCRVKIPKDVSGKIMFHDNNNILVLEINKIRGKEVEIGLNEGDYRVINFRDQKIYECKIKLKNEQVLALSNDIFRVETDLEENMIRGGEGV